MKKRGSDWKDDAATIIVISITVALLWSVMGCAQETVDSDQIATPESPVAVAPGRVEPFPSSSGGNWPSSSGDRVINPSSPRQNNIDRSYILTFNQAERRLSFLATFRMRGTYSTTVRLVAPAKISINSQLLNPSQAVSRDAAIVGGVLLPILAPFLYLGSGTHYFADLPAVPNSSHTILFVDQIGQEFIDHMRVEPFDVLDLPRRIRRNENLAIRYYGSGGEVRARLQQLRDYSEPRPANNPSGRAHAENSPSGSEIVFTSRELQNLVPNQPAELHIERIDRSSGHSVSKTTVYQIQRSNIAVD